MERKRGEIIADGGRSMCKGPEAGRNLVHEDQDRWNRDAYVMRLEGWAGADYVDPQRLQIGLWF